MEAINYVYTHIKINDVYPRCRDNGRADRSLPGGREPRAQTSLPTRFPWSTAQMPNDRGPFGGYLGLVPSLLVEAVAATARGSLLRPGQRDCRQDESCHGQDNEGVGSHDRFTSKAECVSGIRYSDNQGGILTEDELPPFQLLRNGPKGWRSCCRSATEEGL